MRWSLQRPFACHLLLQCFFLGSAKQVLAIVAANSEIDWRMVESASVKDWLIDELPLPDFGQIMKERSFQDALDHSFEAIQGGLRGSPDALLLQSKGLGIATWLASKGLWRGPLVLLSPIPNSCDHISGGSWEAEWNATMQFLDPLRPVAIGTGTSSDEEEFIVKSIEETGVCGQIRRMAAVLRPEVLRVGGGWRVEERLCRWTIHFHLKSRWHRKNPFTLASLLLSVGVLELLIC